jgi:hypothetical protein
MLLASLARFSDHTATTTAVRAVEWECVDEEQRAHRYGRLRDGSAIGQLLTGPGVLAGTTITKYLGSADYGTQYDVSTAQKTVGGGAWGTHPA